MTAKEFKNINNYRGGCSRCCNNCLHYVVKTSTSGPESVSYGMCSANGDKHKLFFSGKWQVCDAWNGEKPISMSQKRMICNAGKKQVDELKAENEDLKKIIKELKEKLSECHTHTIQSESH